MTRDILLTAALALLAAAPVLAAAAQGPDPDATLRDLEQRLAAAWVKGDRAFIEALLAPDWTVIDQSGRVLTKQQVLTEAFESSDRRIDAMEIDDVRVRLFGTTAVVTGRTRATGSYRGTSAFAQLRFTDVFVHDGGRWRVVASQGSLIAP